LIRRLVDGGRRRIETRAAVVWTLARLPDIHNRAGSSSRF
jgi:hypothetical protein